MKKRGWVPGLSSQMEHAEITARPRNINVGYYFPLVRQGKKVIQIKRDVEQSNENSIQYLTIKRENGGKEMRKKCSKKQWKI